MPTLSHTPSDRDDIQQQMAEIWNMIAAMFTKYQQLVHSYQQRSLEEAKRERFLEIRRMGGKARCASAVRDAETGELISYDDEAAARRSFVEAGRKRAREAARNPDGTFAKPVETQNIGPTGPVEASTG